MSKVYYNQIEFLYNLTNVNQYLNHQGLSKQLKAFTPQTIQNWFASFKKQKFNYYHSLKLEKLGLTNIFVMDDNPIEHPCRNSLQEIYNPSNFNKSKLAHYIVPTEKLDQFKITGCNYKTNLNIYPPYHKLLTKDNQLSYSKLQKSDFEKQLLTLEHYIKNLNSIKPTDILKKEPLILPIAFESRNNNLYSVNIWNSIKQKLNNNLKGYMSTNTTDQEAIKKVQSKIKLLNNELNHLVQQTDVEYPKLLSGTQAIAFCIKYNNLQELKNFTSSILMHSAKTSIYPNEKDALIIAHIGISAIKEFLESPLETKAFFLGKFIEQNTFDYSKCFNPVTKTWII